ncbi:(2Fe-2S)-binding protein [Methylobacter sp. BlB1]|uniref:(2Fe-2S)-binding protein n=1 Tax=Methylobacter sp. BlB1 TaxID=2785914 RepID=UPI001E627C6F|nr:(2Fe-2S)-binding protein [Methylobacter sp. BlB1]
MNDIDLNDKDFICYCSGTTKEKIKELIDKGIDDLDSISKLTDACAGCGSCETAVSELIAEFGQSDVLQADEVLQG